MNRIILLIIILGISISGCKKEVSQLPKEQIHARFNMAFLPLNESYLYSTQWILLDKKITAKGKAVVTWYYSPYKYVSLFAYPYTTGSSRIFKDTLWVDFRDISAFEIVGKYLIITTLPGYPGSKYKAFPDSMKLESLELRPAFNVTMN